MLEKEAYVEGKRKPQAIEREIVAGMGHSLRNDEKRILPNGKSKMPYRLLTRAFFNKGDQELRLAVRRNDALPCGDDILEPMDLKAEGMFQINIHIDDAALRILSESIAVFIDDYGVVGIFHLPAFLLSYSSSGLENSSSR